jgi:hypothetical protein
MAGGALSAHQPAAVGEPVKLEPERIHAEVLAGRLVITVRDRKGLEVALKGGLVGGAEGVVHGARVLAPDVTAKPVRPAAYRQPDRIVARHYGPRQCSDDGAMKPGYWRLNNAESQWWVRAPDAQVVTNPEETIVRPQNGHARGERARGSVVVGVSRWSLLMITRKINAVSANIKSSSKNPMSTIQPQLMPPSF